MRVANRMTDKRLKALTADASCGIVPGLYVGVRKLKDWDICPLFPASGSWFEAGLYSREISRNVTR